MSFQRSFTPRSIPHVDASTVDELRDLPVLEGTRWLCGRRRIDAIVVDFEY